MALTDEDQEALYHALDYRDRMLDGDPQSLEHATDLVFWVVESIAQQSAARARSEHASNPSEPVKGAGPSKPKTRSKMTADELRAFERERKRAQRAAKFVPLNGGTTSATNGGTSVGHLVGQNPISVSPRDHASESLPISSSRDSSRNLSEERLKEESGNCLTLPVSSVPLVSATNGGTGSGTDAGTHALSLWRLIQNEWVKLVHGGKRAGDPYRSRKDFESVAKDAESRSPRDPLAYAVSVMRPYVAHKLSKGQTPEPRWLAADFAGWADAIAKRNGNGAAPKTPWVLEYERLDALWKAAQKRGDKAKEKELYDQIATLGKQVSHA